MGGLAAVSLRELGERPAARAALRSDEELSILGIFPKDEGQIWYFPRPLFGVGEGPRSCREEGIGQLLLYLGGNRVMQVCEEAERMCECVRQEGWGQ